MTSCPGVDCRHAKAETGGPPAPSEREIGLLVDRFYDKVRQDGRLGPIFLSTIAEHAWPRHLATMRDFWSSVMLTSGRYHGNPVAAHRKLDGVTPQDFEQWLRLFAETCDELFEPSLAGAFMEKARRIASSLQLAMFFRPEDLAPKDLAPKDSAPKDLAPKDLAPKDSALNGLRVSGAPRRSPR